MKFSKLPVALLALAVVGSLNAQASAQSMSELRSNLADTKFRRSENLIEQMNVSADDFPLKIPRIFAPVRSATWNQSDQFVQLDVNPEITHWILTTKQSLSGLGTVRVEFDARPLTASEVSPITASADGSFWLPAHYATTTGEKLRYEPQPFKNTVGYWTQSNDHAVWKFRVDRPGKFNLAILQGCGAGQGGSIGYCEFSKLDSEVVAKEEFEVKETGHFQNFQWIQLLPIEIKEVGEYQLKVAPKKIRKSAMMDIRAVQLVKLPG